MTSPSQRASVRGINRVLLALLALLGLSSGLAGEALGQCSLVSGPTKLTCPDCNVPFHFNPPQVFNPGAGWVGVYKNSAGSDRLLVPMTWGAIPYSLASPASPNELAVWDLRSAGQTGPGAPTRDGQSYGTGYGLSSDGQRMLFSLHIPMAQTLVSVPSGDKFSVQGNTGFVDASVVVQMNGGRYIAYGLGTFGSFFATDITALPGYSANPIPFETPSLFSSSAQSLGLAEGGSPLKQYLYSYDSAGVTVVDVSNPGPAGSITSGFVARSIPTATFGLPPGNFLVGVSAAVDPATGNLYVLGSFWNASNLPSFSLVLYGAGTPSLVGTYTAPFEQGANAVYNAAAGSNVGTLAANPITGDVMAFMFVRSTSLFRNKLYATPVRSFGSPITQSADIVGTAGSLSGTSILFKSPPGVAYAYFWDGNNPWAMQLSCQAGPVEAAGRLSVSNTSTGGTSLSSGATVFVGDTLTVTPSVTPSNAIQAITGWNIDLDYHASTETGTIGVMRLSFPDACLNGCFNAFTSNLDPPAFTLVGPCDFQKSGVPTTGTGCWNSVGPSPGNGDFASAQPDAGTTATLPIAFEASNALNTTTVPLATFNIVWKVPAVKVLNLSGVLNNSSATFVDGSEGHPIAYKWYFGIDPAAPAGERLAQAACTGSSCGVSFPGKGTYNAWLTASYNGGYSSPDCVQPCGGAPRSFKVIVTDFVAAFTVDANSFLGGNINVTNSSQAGLGVTGVSYSYNLCQVISPATSCAEGTYTPLSFTGTSTTIAAPSPVGTWWLRIKADYTNGTAQTAHWQPNVTGVSDINAWPISVSAVPPSIAPTAGFGTCNLAGCPASYTGAAGRAITVALFQGATRLTGSYSWSVTGSATASGTGATFTFTPSSAGLLTVAVTGGTSPLPNSINISITGGSPPPPPPPPPSGLSVSVSASNPAPPVGTAISLFANASGGTPPYTTYEWNFGDGTPVASSGFSSVSHTYSVALSRTATCTVRDSNAGAASGTTTINVQPPAAAPSSIQPTAGFGNCSVPGCPSAYTGNAGSPLTIAAFQGATRLSGNYAWTVTGVNANPSAGTGSTFTFTPLEGGTATVTNTTLGVSVRIFIVGSVADPDFLVSDDVRGNVPAGSDGNFLVVRGRSTAFTAVELGTTTPLTGAVTWDFGDGNSSNLNPAHNTYSTLGAFTVKLTFAGQPVTHAVFPVDGIPTGLYHASYADGGTLDPNRVDPNRTILFQAAENFAATYSWNFHDGTQPQTGPAVNHSFAAPGSYTVVLTETLGGSTFTTAVPVTFVAAVAPTWIVPGLAYAPGVLPGSFYVSDVTVENPHPSQEMSLQVGLADGTAPASIAWKGVVLQPMESRTQSNILQSAFGKAAGGPATALIVKGDSLPANTVPVIWASTYNNNGGDPTKGTFGVAIPAVPLSGAISPASSGALCQFPGLRDVPPPPLVSVPNVSPAYTNVGFVNAGDVPATLKVNFYSSHEGTLFQRLGDEVILSLGPNETRQLTQALTKRTPLGAGWDPAIPAENYFMTVIVAGGDKIVPYTTVKDIGSSDSVFTANDGTLSTTYRVPAVVRANGQNQTAFRSRLILFNSSGSSRTVRLALSFLKCVPGGGSCDPRQVVTGNLPLASGQTVIYEDFVKEWLAAHDTILHEELDYTTSFVDVSPADLNTDPILVRAETYNATPAGNFGTQVPGLVASIHGASTAAGGSGSRLIIPRALPNGGTSGFRTNVALVLLSETPGTAKVRLYKDIGGSPVLPEVSLSLTAGEPFLQRSLEKLFPGLSSLEPSNKYSLEVVVTDGTIGAYASINDNVTGDSTMMVGRPQR